MTREEGIGERVGEERRREERGGEERRRKERRGERGGEEKGGDERIYNIMTEKWEYNYFVLKLGYSNLVVESS